MCSAELSTEKFYNLGASSIIWSICNTIKIKSQIFKGSKDQMLRHGPVQDVSVLVTSVSSGGLELPGPLGLHIKNMSVCVGEFRPIA